jgi:hypothetical protein
MYHRNAKFGIMIYEKLACKVDMPIQSVKYMQLNMHMLKMHMFLLILLRVVLHNHTLCYSGFIVVVLFFKKPLEPCAS